MRALLNSKSQYKNVTIMRVDWDTNRDGDIVKELKIPRRSTLVMFNKGKEVGRVVAQTSTAAIEALFKAAM
ncbi:MAG: thioredoxin 1 [Gammaproteobacteria bacterium]